MTRARSIGRPAATLSLAVAAAGLVACSAAAPAAGDAGASGTITCVPESGPYQVDTYSADMKRTGENGILSFELVRSDPAPPALGNNTFVVKISRADGSPFTGDLYIDPRSGVFMPLHGHGASVLPVVTFDPASGTSTLTPMDLFMPGLWRITLQGDEAAASSEAGIAGDGGMQVAQSAVDIGVFYFCVE